MSCYHDVLSFNIKYGLPAPFKPHLLSDDLYMYRYKFLHEELTEFAHAHEISDLPGMADALADLVYVALGTAIMMGIPFPLIWDRVQEANMKKVKTPHPEHSKRSHVLDVIKPPDWVPPTFTDILGPGPWPTLVV